MIDDYHWYQSTVPAMGDGITTRVQKEVSNLQRKVEALRAEMASNNIQLRKEIQDGIDKNGGETRKMIEQFMLKFEVLKGVGVTESNGSFEDKQQKLMGPAIEGRGVSSARTEHIDLTGISRPLTKYSKLECPRFDGTNFRGWLLKMEQFFEADQTREEDKVRSVMVHMDGKALQWHQ